MEQTRHIGRSVALLLALSISAAEAASQAQPQPLGQLAVVAGHRVHIYCSGQGGPTVIVASGGFSFDWGLVQPKVAEFTRICAYDPSGTAWSERVKPGDQVTCEDRVNELHELLSTSQISSPYVIVGFSVGALVARLYATRYPSEIAGMVLVDHAFIDTGGNSGATTAQRHWSNLDSPPVLISKTPIQLDLEDDENFKKLPERDQELHRWALSISDRPTPEMAARCFSEVASEEKSVFPLGNKPLVVVSTDNKSPRYAELQQKLLSLSHNSERLIAHNSTHMVIIDQPEIAVAAIKEAVSAVRGNKPLSD